MSLNPADYGRTVAALAALPELVATLEAELVAGRRGRGSRAGKPGSRPPVDLDLVSDIDDAWNVVTTWAHDWAETYDHTPPRPHWADVCGYLGRHWPNAADTHPAAYEFADEIAGTGPTLSVWVRLSRHVDHGRPRTWEPLPGRWRCPAIPPETAVKGPSSRACGGTLLQKVGEWVVRCPRCGAHWDGDTQIELLGRALGCDPEVTIDQAAQLARVHPATVYRWVSAGQLPTVTRDGRTLVDKRDLALVSTRRRDTPA